MPYLFKALGATGMFLLVCGIMNQNSLKRNTLFSVGGLMLFTYSVYLRDPIFIPLEAIFALSSIYEIYKIKKHK